MPLMQTIKLTLFSRLSGTSRQHLPDWISRRVLEFPPIASYSESLKLADATLRALRQSAGQPK